MSELTPLQQRLFALQDEAYGDFQSKLMPGIPRESIIGVRMPDLRKFAKAFAKEPESQAFLRQLPHRFYEENNLHMLLIDTVKDYDRTVTLLEDFLPFVDNWATCDLSSPKSFKKHHKELIGDIRRWMDSGETYTIRYGVEALMNHFLEEDFRPEYLDWVTHIQSEEYYVRMMAAWFFATALAKQYDAALPILEQQRLPLWTHNKTIQKAVESYRITPEQKTYLKSLRKKAAK